MPEHRDDEEEVVFGALRDAAVRDGNSLAVNAQGSVRGQGVDQRIHQALRIRWGGSPVLHNLPVDVCEKDEVTGLERRLSVRGRDVGGGQGGILPVGAAEIVLKTAQLYLHVSDCVALQVASLSEVDEAAEGSQD